MQASLSEQELVSGVIAGDVGARQEFYDRYRRLVWERLHRFELCNADREDLFQEFFLHLLEDDCRRLRQWGRGSLVSFIYTSAGNLCRDFLRSRHGSDRQSGSLYHASDEDEDGWVEIDVPDPAPSPQEQCELQEMVEAVRAALAEMSQRDRDLLVRFEQEGKSYEQIASALRLSVNQVGVYLNRARSRLRTRLVKAHPTLFADNARGVPAFLRRRH